MIAPFLAKKSYSDGHVAVSVTLKASGWGDRVQVTGGADMTTEQARVLAQALVALADEADAKVARKAAEKERRQKWRDREIAAGRMVVFDGLRR